jgi:hypothetical protein
MDRLTTMIGQEWLDQRAPGRRSSGVVTSMQADYRPVDHVDEAAVKVGWVTLA